MIYSKQIFILFISLAFSSCIVPSKFNEHNSWSVELSKGNCMDICDSYGIYIDQFRKYTYKGYYNVKYIGEKTGFISSDQLSELKDLLDSLDWIAFKPQYGTPGTGIQRKALLFSSKNQIRSVTYYRLEPQQIRDLELFIDQLITLDDI